MPSKETNAIDGEWESFKKCCVDIIPGITPAEVSCIRKVFFSGALAQLGLDARTILESDSKGAAAISMLNDLSRFVRFMDEIKGEAAELSRVESMRKMVTPKE